MLDDEANALSNRSKTLKAELDEANNRVVALAEELSSAQREREKLAETLHEMTRLLDEEKNQKAQNDELLRKTQEEAEELRVKIRIAEVELVGAHNKISDLSKVADTLKDESGRMAEVMDALERRQTEIAMLREQAATTETALENEQKHNANLACELDAVKEKLQKEMELARLAGADAARLSGELDECKAKLEINIEALAERDSEIEANLIIISTLKIEFDELSKKLEDARTANVQLDSVQRELAIKDAQLAEKTEILSDRESVIAQKDALLSEKESLIAEKDALLSEKESLIAEKDALLSEKSVALVEKDTLLSEKDVELTEKAASFAEFLKTIDSFKEREQALEAELNERKKDLEETAGAMSKMEEKVIALNQSKVGMSMELADAIQTSERLNSEIAEYKTRQAEQESQIADLKNKLEKAKNQAIEQSDAVMQLKRLSGDVLNLQKSLSEKTALVDSLTEQLEDRQQRASKLERQNKDLSERIKEHEGDTAAWDMELKLRSARISQLEKELAEALNK